MILYNSQATVVEWGPGPQTVQADRYAMYKMELEPTFRAISGLTGNAWDNYKGSFLIKNLLGQFLGRGSTYFYRGIKIVNNTGYGLFLPDNSDLEKKLVYYHVKEVPNVTTTQEKYQDGLTVGDTGYGFNADHVSSEHFPNAVWVDVQGKLRNDRTGPFGKTSAGPNLCFSDNTYAGYGPYTAIAACGTGWVDGGVSSSLLYMHNDNSYYTDYVGHTWADYCATLGINPDYYALGALSTVLDDGNAWGVQDEYASMLRVGTGDLFVYGATRYNFWWTYVMSKNYTNYDGSIVDESAASQSNQLGGCPNGYPWVFVTLRYCYKSSTQGS
jgi:hypothetical protein